MATPPEPDKPREPSDASLGNVTNELNVPPPYRGLLYETEHVFINERNLSNVLHADMRSAHVADHFSKFCPCEDCRFERREDIAGPELSEEDKKAYEKALKKLQREIWLHPY